MTDELHLKGIGVAPGVLDTIVTLATQNVEGVESVDSVGGLAGLVQRGATKCPVVAVGEDGSLSVTLHVTLRYGAPLHETAAKIQTAVAEALRSQVGQPVCAVDVFVDAVSFAD